MMDTRAAERSARISVRRFASAGEADRHDLAYWLEIPPDQRLALVEQLTEDLWRMRGEWPDEPGLRRSVTRVVRR